MKEKVVIITGGTSGIGRALAEEFGRRGSTVVITGRSEEAVMACTEALTQKGIRALGVRADVTQIQDNVRMVEETLNAFGRIDIICHEGLLTGDYQEQGQYCWNFFHCGLSRFAGPRWILRIEICAERVSRGVAHRIAAHRCARADCLSWFHSFQYPQPRAGRGRIHTGGITETRREDDVG